jgi:hypothetical protein
MVTMSRKNRREARKSLGLPDLEVLRDQMAYEVIVREEYEREKQAFEVRKAGSADRLQSADLEIG